MTRQHSLQMADIDAVVEVLRSDWITQGPKIQEFEERLAAYCGARYGVAFSSGTAALHAACAAAGIAVGDEVITTPLTFVATANAAVYQGGVPVFADINASTLTIDPAAIDKKITPKTKAIIPMHFAGLPCEMDGIADLARRKQLTVIEDACHALGAQWQTSDGRLERIGSCSHSDMAICSFHPVKHITTGEGGIVLTNRKDLLGILRAFRHHGIVRPDEMDLVSEEPWAYEMRFLGYNYRITDFQCALGIRQLERLAENLERRRAVAAHYRDAFDGLDLILQDGDSVDRRHAWHLYVVQLATDSLVRQRTTIFRMLRQAGLPVNVHYLPVYLHPFYRQRFGYRPGHCPRVERYYHRALSLPIFHGMSDDDVGYVVQTVQDVLRRFAA